MLDPIEAFAFSEVTGQAQLVYEGHVPDGVPWVVVDMDAFVTRHP